MAGGSGAAMTTLPTMYASILGLDFDQLSSSLMAVLMVANILAIVFAAIMDKIGKAHPAWSGEGNLLMESGQAVKEEVAETKEAKKNGTELPNLAPQWVLDMMNNK